MKYRIEYKGYCRHIKLQKQDTTKLQIQENTQQYQTSVKREPNKKKASATNANEKFVN